MYCGVSAQALASVDAVLVLQGFQPDPLTTALVARWGERADNPDAARRGPRAAT
jgi:hypothetical protein